MRRKLVLLLALAAGIAAPIGAPALAGITDILAAPKTLFDRVIEARSTSDIVKDNEIVLAVNRIMAELGTIKASTEIYEQRLLVTGLFDDAALHKNFRERVKAVRGVRKIYWHVAYLSKTVQERRKKELIGWSDALVLDAKVGLALIGARGVADVNFRVATDAFGTVYLIGRARSKEELAKALKLSRATTGAKRVVNYVEVRP